MISFIFLLFSLRCLELFKINYYLILLQTEQRTYNI